jgi:hypothetical protein
MTTDTITFVEGIPGSRATKMWMADGDTANYDAGWKFKHHTVAIADLAALAALLEQAQPHPHIHAIRGTFKGDAHAQTISRPDEKDGRMMPAVVGGGWYRKWKELFDDMPHHWMCIDIDNYTPPLGIDPVLDPTRAISAFIGQHLPAAFYGAGYHWQLSSSAGHPTKKGLLKAHVWFWLETPHTGAELEAWAPEAIDRTLYRVIQAHYTALPVFAPGVVDPVPQRHGNVPGGLVPLVLTPAERSAAAAPRAGRDMIDPRTKTGIVGAFCRTYSVESLLEPGSTLADQFEYVRGSDRRLNWVGGSSANAQGAYLSDDRLHLCNEHAHSPVGNTPLNAFDAVRVYCFGHHDREPGVHPMVLNEMRTTPSYKKMCDWAMGLAPVVDAMRAENEARMSVPAGVVPGVVTPVSTPEARAVAGETLLFPPAQVAHFAGCVYVSSIHKILTPGGKLYDQQRFNAVYGGFSFIMDGQNARTVRSAWECFLESQAVMFPKVDGCAFRPELPPGSVLALEGYTYANIYVPIETRQVEGDITPFLRLVEKMLPNERDRRILLTYMASMIRNPGVKFQWWPVLQGAEGNGKTAFIRVLQHCVGHRYSHLPNTGEMAKNGIKFTAWIVGRLFLGFEEVFVPGRREFLEEMKPIVTNDSLQVEAKGVDQTMEDNRANGLMCTNHEDGVPVSVDGRRYAVFYTAQQSKADKIRDGMCGDYFPDLYDWFKGKGAYAEGGLSYGYAVVNWYLQTQYVLSAEFDPAGACQEAPSTSSSAAAIKASMGTIEQEILEAIEQDEQGFRGGWVSSAALTKLLARIGKGIPINKRRSVMQSLGYDWHPHLKDGRATHPTILDGPGKIRIYAKRDALITQITDHREIMAKYISAQQ